MNDHISLLLQGYVAKRKLAELFRCEEVKQVDHPSIAITTHDGYLRSRQPSNKIAKLFEKIVASGDLFVNEHRLCYERVSEAK